MAEDLPDKKKIYCNMCKNETNHILIGEHLSDYYQEQDGQLIHWEKTIFRFWVCAGCDEGTLEDCWTMQQLADRDGNQIFESTYYPSRKLEHIQVKRFRNLPTKLKKLYRESIEAYNNKLLILCAGGLRALIEGICVDKGITGKNLYEKIEAMTSILPKNIVEHLHSFRFVGNDALHELIPPERRDAALALEVIEDLMNYLYELDYKANRLKKKRKNQYN